MKKALTLLTVVVFSLFVGLTFGLAYWPIVDLLEDEL